MKSHIRKIVEKAWKSACEKGIFDELYEIPEFDVSETKSKKHGDISTNIAMVSAKVLKMPPFKIAEKLLGEIDDDVIEKKEIAGPGFLNFFIKKDAYPPMLEEIFKEKENFGSNNLGEGRKIQIEFVSANPTGPLHIGHGRGAAVGDCVGRILSRCGYEVKREYYVNDSGRQIETLGRSVYLRYLESLGKIIDFPEDHYQGEYIKNIAGEAAEQFKEKLDNADEKEAVKLCAVFASEKILNEIKNDLNNFKVFFDNWFSEQSLYDDNKVLNKIEAFEKKGVVYEKDGARWFKTTDYGDEKDRVVIRSNNETTYFASDIAYHIDKFERGFDEIIDVLGADHHGYIKRIQACINASGFEVKNFDVILVQLVTLLRSGKLVQMSTRAGEFDTLSEVVEEVGVDAARFFFLMRSYDSKLDFDLDLARKKSSENPVYYVQYVHARICSILEKSSDEYGISDENIKNADIFLLNNDEEIDLIKALIGYKDAVFIAGRERQPHRITYYLMELAGFFHAYYNKHKILSKNTELACARLYLVKAVRQVVRNGLELLGINAPDKM
ncbi:MAG: arginine--tRNA ligase [Deltaproteobacteria bacterium]|nr:MAG: arginine--tRNA ligase [Deltaproteobacteria bacterium]